MARPALPTLRRFDGVLGTVMRDVHTTFAGLLDNPHLFGVNVPVVFTGVGVPVLVVTTLKGPITGYQVKRANADVRVWEGAPAGIVSTDVAPGSIWLQASGAATVTIYLHE